jgi:hypothetical protein
VAIILMIAIQCGCCFLPLQPYLKMVITRMCHFFNAISKKVIDVVELDEIHKEMHVTMCQLEMFFPPSFDIPPLSKDG